MSMLVRRREGSVRRGLRIRIVGSREERIESGKHVSLFADRPSNRKLWVGLVGSIVNSSLKVGEEEKRNRVSAVGDRSQFMCSFMNISLPSSSASFPHLSKSL